MLLIGYFLVASRLVASEAKIDLGIALAPSVVPEVDYSKMRMRSGIEVGVSFWNYTNENLISIKGIDEKPRANLKLARLGIAYIENNYGIVFTPLSVNIQDKLYFAPSFIFSNKPYQTISISYELW